MKRLFVLSGGGMRGLDVLAGQLHGLEDAGILPDAISGTSAGAAIGALTAFGHTAGQVCTIISGLRDRDVRSERFAWKPRALWIDHFLENKPIRNLLQRWLPSTSDALAIPFAATTTRTRDGAETVWTSDQGALPGNPMPPDWRDCVLASMSISGVFPWVCIGDANYADGGVRANLPLPATWLQFDEVYLLIASYKSEYHPKRHSIISRLLLNAEWYARDQIDDVFDRIALARAKLLVIPKVTVIFPPELTASPCGMLRFDHNLIPHARQIALTTAQHPHYSQTT